VTTAVAPVAAAVRPRARVPLHRVGLVGLGGATLLATVVVVSLIGPVLWRVDPLEQNIEQRLQNPSPAHPLGTDQFGRDLLARLLHGARWTLLGAAAVCLGVSAFGFTAGAVAASGSRLTDSVLGRLIESLMALPSLVTALAVTSVLGPSFRNLLIAIIVTSWPWYARAYRSVILRERAASYVEGAVALGASRGRVVVRHILPNVIGPALVLATTNLGNVILSLAALSFLGLGIQPPTPEWGMMINDARSFFQRQPWQMIAPGLCIVLTVLAVNLTGDAIRDTIDPRTGLRR
jgi:peptide/nickel transport system permease protein